MSLNGLQHSKRSARAALEAQLALIEAEIVEREELQRRKAQRETDERARAEEGRRAALRTAGLPEFIPLASPKLLPPRHLAPLVRVFERIDAGERVRAVVDVSAQHGKTTTCLHAIAWLLQRHPTWPLAYVTFSQTQANRKSFEAQTPATSTGLLNPSVDRVTMEEWRLAATGGGCIFAGVGGPVSGNPARAMIFDDFFKNRVEAESQLLRDQRFEWMTSVAIPRLPQDGSALVISTRWHPDDPSGRIRNGELGKGWEFVSLPFLATRNERGERVADDFGDDVLWPREQLPDGAWVGWTPELARERLGEVGPYDAASIYQGKPRARGGTVYQQPVRCDAPQVSGARLVIGCDPAGTDGPNSNHSVLVGLAVREVVDAETRERVTVADVAGVLRLRLRPEHAAPQVLAWQRSFAGAPLHIESTRDGKELGRALQAISPGLSIVYVPAIGDKFLRAQPAASAWNAGRIRVPSDARTMRSTTDEDLAAFVRVVTNFSGMGGEDDDADALAHAWAVATEVAAPLPVIADAAYDF